MGIFKQQTNDFTTYRATIAIRSRIVGGIPDNPKSIFAWLSKATGITDQAILQQMVLERMDQLEMDAANVSVEDALRVSGDVAVARNLNVFMGDRDSLYLESRCMKAALREATSVAFGGQRWAQDDPATTGGKKLRPDKGSGNLFRERVFIFPDRLFFLDRTPGIAPNAPDDVPLFIGHVMTAQGPRNNVSFNHVVDAPTITFDVAVFRDSVPEAAWPTIWNVAEELGCGSMRSQGYGRFDLVEWRQLDPGEVGYAFLASYHDVQRQRTFRQEPQAFAAD